MLRALGQFKAGTTLNGIQELFAQYFLARIDGQLEQIHAGARAGQALRVVCDAHLLDREGRL